MSALDFLIARMALDLVSDSCKRPRPVRIESSPSCLINIGDHIVNPNDILRVSEVRYFDDPTVPIGNRSCIYLKDGTRLCSDYEVRDIMRRLQGRP